MSAPAQPIVLQVWTCTPCAFPVEGPNQGCYFGGAEGRVAVCDVLPCTRARTKEATKEVN
jgi:hypothetical protein